MWNCGSGDQTWDRFKRHWVPRLACARPGRRCPYSSPSRRRGPSVLYRHPLFRSEDPVPGIAEPRQDIAMIVQLAIDRGRIDGDIGMRSLERADALGTGHETDEADRARLGFLQPLDGGD